MNLKSKKLRTTEPKPWQRRRPRPFRREVMVLDQAPLAQICIYNDCVILTRRDPSGAWRSYPISPEALATALGKLPTTTGLLPGGTIGTGVKDGSPFFVQYIRPHAIALPVDEAGKEKVYRFQAPPLIWAAWKDDYRIWAVTATESIQQHEVLYKAPFPNCYDTGAICWGSARPKPATPATMGETLKLFLEESRFNAHVANDKSKRQPANVLRLYATLKPDKPYPLQDLVPSSASRSLSMVLQGMCWGRTYGH